jgi:hypothetical protein
MFQTNLREVDAGLDVEQVLDFIEDYGANAWLISVGGILSNYPTDLPFQTRNPHLVLRPSGDLIGDALEAAARRSVHVLARMDFSKVDHRRAEEHPEWCFVDSQGERQVYNGLTSVCPSGDYYQQHLFAIVDEVLDRYAVDGFFFNWMSYNEVDYSKAYRGVCQCLACHRAFTSYAPGTSLPTGPESPGYQAWRGFAASMLDDLTARVRAYIAGRRPAAALILGDRADIVFHEANNAVGRPLWHHRTAQAVSAAKSHRPEVPVLVNSVGFVDMPYRLAGEEPHHFAQYLVQAISRGANPSTYIMGTPQVIDYECLDIGREIIRFHRDHQHVYDHLVSDARIALVQPASSGRGPVAMANATSEFQGLYLSLQERHVPFDVIGEHHLANRADGAHGLEQYRAIVLPDLGRLEESLAEVLDRFVAAGGVVVTTGSSAFDRDRPQLQAMPILRRLASHESVEAVRSLHLHVEDGDGRVLPVPVIGSFHMVEPRPEATLRLPAISRAPYGPPEKCHGHMPLSHSGLLIGATTYGGALVVLPWTVGRGYREVGLSTHRDLFVDALLEMAPEVGAPAFGKAGGSLPEVVEIVVGRSAAGQVIHLINRSGDADQRFRQPVAIRGAMVGVDPAATRVRALWAGQDLPIERRNGQAGVALPDLELFEVLLVETTPAS